MNWNWSIVKKKCNKIIKIQLYFSCWVNRIIEVSTRKNTRRKNYI